MTLEATMSKSPKWVRKTESMKTSCCFRSAQWSGLQVISVCGTIEYVLPIPYTSKCEQSELFGQLLSKGTAIAAVAWPSGTLAYWNCQWCRRFVGLRQWCEGGNIGWIRRKLKVNSSGVCASASAMDGASTILSVLLCGKTLKAIFYLPRILWNKFSGWKRDLGFFKRIKLLPFWLHLELGLSKFRLFWSNPGLYFALSAILAISTKNKTLKPWTLFF